MPGVEPEGAAKVAARTPHTKPLSRPALSTPTPDVEGAARPRADFEPLFVRIPAGPFLMGTNEGYANEHPQHTVELSEYWISRYPVTNVEYQAFVRDAGHRAPASWNNEAALEAMSDHPVVYVSWEDAVAYCQWLSKKTGRAYWLPTEAQWEKAARSDDARTYPWGHEWDESRLNSRESGPEGTSPVTQYSPASDSPYGVADMVGNVWEWCADWFDSGAYKHRAGEHVVNPEGPRHGDRRVLRGGYGYILDAVRCTTRHGADPVYRGNSVGFRVLWRPEAIDDRSIDGSS